MASVTPEMLNTGTQVNPETEQQKQAIVNNAARLLYDPNSIEQVVKQIQSIKNPVESLGSMSATIMIELDRQSQESGVQLSDEAKIGALVDIVSLVLELGLSRNIYPDMSEEEVGASMAFGVQTYMKHLINTGKVDPQQLQQELNQALDQLPQEKQEELKASMGIIDKTATNSVQQQPQANQQQAPSMLGGQ